MKSWTGSLEMTDCPHTMIVSPFDTFKLHTKSQHAGVLPLRSVRTSYLFSFIFLKAPSDFPHVTIEDQVNEGYWMPKGTLIFTNTG